MQRLGYELTIEQTQKLVMTPELIQAIKILQFNAQELDAHVQEQILTNPVLETKDANSSESEYQANEQASSDSSYQMYLSDARHEKSERKKEEQSERQDKEEFAQAQAADSGLDWKEFIRNSNYGGLNYKGLKSGDDEDKRDAFERYVVNDVTLPEHLMFQYQFAAVNKSCRRVGKYVIESLDENGYMTSSIDEIAKATGTTVDNVNEVLEIIHGFEPAGVGAKDLRECLTIQLKSSGRLTDKIDKIINEHLENIANNRLAVVAKDMDMTVQEVQEVADLIKTLEPKPGRQFASEVATKYIVPDVIVEKIEDEYIVTVNDSNTPQLMVSSYYKSLLNKADDDQQLHDYLQERVESAKWLIKSIEQRKQTIYNVASAIVKYQKEFFDNGSKYLKTLTLKDIAEEVGIHESTVSRSVNGKYLQCPRGVFEMKYFFSAGVSSSSGEGVSSKSIKEFIKELVDNEDPKKPISDETISKRLKAEGFEIARRTVAKYRDELGILSSSKRKRY